MHLLFHRREDSFPADLNCDNIVDAGDLTIVDNNGDGTVGVIKP